MKRLEKSLIRTHENRLPCIRMTMGWFGFFVAISSLWTSLLWTSVASATPSAARTFTLDGRLYNSTNLSTPLIDANVVINVKIFDPLGACLLYEEEQITSTYSTDGYFNIKVGSAVSNSKRTGGDPNNAMAQIFQNNSPISASGCASYSPLSGDGRKIRITVSPSSGSTEVLSPDIEMDSVPMAIVAESVQGLDRSKLLEMGAGQLTQNNVANVFSNSNYPKLTSLLGGTSSDYVRISATTGAAIPSFSADPSGVAAGQVWLDTTTQQLKFHNGVSVQAISSGTMSGGITTLNGLTSPNQAFATSTASGTFAFTSTGTMHVLNVPMASGAGVTAGLISKTEYDSFVGKASSTLTDGHIYVGNGSNVASSVLPSGDVNLANTGVFTLATTGVTAGTYSRVQVDAKGRVLSGSGLSASDIPDLDAAKIVSGVLAATRLPSSVIYDGGNTTGAPLIVGTNDSQALLFETNNIARVTVSASGNVGIGTTTPASALDVSGAVSINGLNGIRFPASDSTAGASIAIGARALTQQESLASTAFRNTAIGFEVMTNAGLTTAAIENTAVGHQALRGLTSGSFNTAVGNEAARATATGGQNTAIGRNALLSATSGSGNSAMGYNALQYSGGTGNTGVGASALGSTWSGATGTGGHNTAVGHAALSVLSTGSENAVLGRNAGGEISTGSRNIVIGSYPTTGGVGVTTGNNNILIGYDVRPSSQTVSDQLNIGNLVYATGLGSATTAAPGNLGIGTTTPAAKLEVKGEIRAGSTGLACTNGTKGSMRYNDVSNVMEYCNGTSWTVMQSPTCSDATPDAFALTTLANQTASTLVTSNILQIIGMNCALTISVSGSGAPALRICSDAACSSVVQDWTTTTSSISSGQYLQLRQTTNAAGGVTNSATVIAGTLASSWNVATTGDCTGLPTSPPPPGTVCADGTIYAGMSVDGNVPMFTTRCDLGQTWDGSNCTGSRWLQSWNNGATGTTITGYGSSVTGKSNSAGLAALGGGEAPYLAATNCENHIENGHSDWYLPARNELATLYDNHTAIGNFNTVTSPSYWSSTENSTTNANYIRFNDSYIGAISKANNNNVRCVRR